MFEHAGSQADALNQPAFPQSGLTHDDDVLLATDEVALGQGFDLHPGDGRVEGPVECAQRQRFAEASLLDEPFDAALAAEAGLIGEQTMQELQMRPAGVLSLFQDEVELLGGHGGEVARYFEADASLFDDAVQADGEEEK